MSSDDQQYDDEQEHQQQPQQKQQPKARKLADPVNYVSVNTFPDYQALKEEAHAQYDNQVFNRVAKGKARGLNEEVKPFDPEVTYVKKPSKEQLEAASDERFRKQMQRFQAKPVDIRKEIDKPQNFATNQKNELNLDDFEFQLVIKIKTKSCIVIVHFAPDSLAEELLAKLEGMLNEKVVLQSVDGIVLKPEELLKPYNKKVLSVKV